MRGRILLLVVGLAILIGCTSTPRDDAKKKSRGVIGVSLLTLENPFFKVIGDTITSEAARHDYETIVLSADKSVAKQSSHIKDFIVRKASAIVLSPCESRSIVPAIKEANEAGISVFTVDIPCDEPGIDIVCQVATNNYLGGKEAGTAMTKALGEAGGTVVILHFPQAESCRLRVKGFREVIEEYNKTAAGKIKIAQEYDGGGAKNPSFDRTLEALNGHADLRGIFAINDPSALGARAALEKEKVADKIKIVGFDGQPEGKQAIKDGKIFADPIQFPDQMGVEVVKAFITHARGGTVERKILIPTKLYGQAEALKDPDLK